ncbi:MAG TPA: hypothetical protein VG672_25000 [Bryobacteraceae bacterium]|nr:hypothetical protein [Bryobacteraceae bacterium]
MRALLSLAPVHQPGVTELLVSLPHPTRSLTPAISAAASQLIFFAIAFKIASCSFIILSTSVALTDPGFFKIQNRRHFVKRTNHV